MFYREHVCRNHNQKKCDNTLGLAQLGTMCKVNSCAIVQDNGLSAAFTIAHELGHVYDYIDCILACLNLMAKNIL